jgi:hypothetical protein
LKRQVNNRAKRVRADAADRPANGQGIAEPEMLSRQGFDWLFFDPIPSALFTLAAILWRRFFLRVLRTFTPVVIRSASFFTGRRFAVRFFAMTAPVVPRSL